MIFNALRAGNRTGICTLFLRKATVPIASMKFNSLKLLPFASFFFCGSSVKPSALLNLA